MPFYEFYCPTNHTVYTFFARSFKHAGSVPRCPDDPEAPMQKQISQFSFVKALGVEGDPALDDAKYDDPRYENAINELEREFQGMDENNLDPQQLGHLMRKVSEVTGQRLPGSLEEMAKRLEKGEDPEALEDEYGDNEEEFDPMAGVEGSAGKRLIRRLRSVPRQDPGVYEMEDYLD
ncbi:MAG: cytochrome C [Verrucomicrobiota bacterium]